MNILISNDDGIESDGIKALANILSKKHNVYIVAPDSQKSAMSQSLTIRDKIAVKTIKKEEINAKKIITTSGTPADCVKLAITTLLKKDELPDVVISGINHGPNLGHDVCYSGTVAAALEAARLGYKAIAVSIVAKEWNYNDFVYPAEFVSYLLENYPDTKVGTVLNINIPKVDKSEIKGLSYTHLAGRVFTSEYAKVSENDKVEEYVLAGVPAYDSQSDLTDIQAVRQCKISITPLNFNMTDNDTLNNLTKTSLVSCFL